MPQMPCLGWQRSQQQVSYKIVGSCGLLPTRQGRVQSPTWVPLQCSACLYILWGSKPKRRQWFMVPANFLAAQVAKAKRLVPQVPSHSLSTRMLRRGSQSPISATLRSCGESLWSTRQTHGIHHNKRDSGFLPKQQFAFTKLRRGTNVWRGWRPNVKLIEPSMLTLSGQER